MRVCRFRFIPNITKEYQVPEDLTENKKLSKPEAEISPACPDGEGQGGVAGAGGTTGGVEQAAAPGKSGAGGPAVPAGGSGLPGASGQSTAFGESGAGKAAGPAKPVLPRGQAALHDPIFVPPKLKLFYWFFLLLLLFSLYLLYQIYRPFLNTIILGCIFAALCYPLYAWVLKRVGNRRVLAASLIMLFWILVVAAVIVFLIAGITPQAIESINSISQWLTQSPYTGDLDSFVAHINEWLQAHLPQIDLSRMDIRGNLVSFIRGAGQYMISFGTNLLTHTLSFIMHFFIMLLIMFFLLIDGGKMVQRLLYLFPLKPEQTESIILSLRKTSKAVLVGGFMVAAIQGIAAGVGLAIVGIPALFWGFVMIFAAFVPAIGTALIWFPVCVYFFAIGRWQSALFLLIWCGVGVSTIDSFLRPFLMRDGIKLPVVLIFLAILGGLQAFGVLGLLYGPLILGFVTAMLNIYSEEFSTILQKRQPGAVEGGTPPGSE